MNEQQYADLVNVVKTMATILSVCTVFVIVAVIFFINRAVEQDKKEGGGQKEE